MTIKNSMIKFQLSKRNVFNNALKFCILYQIKNHLKTFEHSLYNINKKEKYLLFFNKNYYIRKCILINRVIYLL